MRSASVSIEGSYTHPLLAQKELFWQKNCIWTDGYISFYKQGIFA
jgi:hypothetical protein